MYRYNLLFICRAARTDLNSNLESVLFVTTRLSRATLPQTNTQAIPRPPMKIFAELPFCSHLGVHACVCCRCICVRAPRVVSGTERTRKYREKEIERQRELCEP